MNDVTKPTCADRPGMPVVTRLPNGNYVMTHEYCGAPEGGCSVYYKISADPEAFGAATDQVLRATDGTIPSGAPYVTWLPTGGPNGTLAVSGDTVQDLFLNTQNGAPNAWTRIGSNVARGYSRGLLPLSDGHSLMVFSAGRAGVSTLNPVQSSLPIPPAVTPSATASPASTSRSPTPPPPSAPPPASGAKPAAPASAGTSPRPP